MPDLVIVVQDSDGKIKQETIIQEYDPKDIIVAKIGSDKFPATCDMIERFTGALKKALETKGEHKLLIWNHAISFEKIELKESIK